MKPNIKQISNMTGVSIATVSNALNRKKGVNKNTADMVFKAAREIGYLNISNISKIKFLIFKKNGFIIDDTPFFTALIDGFEKECRESGFEMVLGTLDCRQEDYKEQFQQGLKEADTAIVLLGTELSADDLEYFKQVENPVLLLDYWDCNMSFNAVVINHRDSVRRAVNYLAEKGHREIGYLRGDFRILNFQQREHGYKEAMNAIGYFIEPYYVVTLNTTMDGACRDMEAYLEGKPMLPTAFVAENDMLALGAMRALYAAGYKIPEDISMIGFDDLPFCEISYPRLTSLKVPKQEMGAIAVRRVIEMIRKECYVKTKTEICTEFVERESVKSLLE